MATENESNKLAIIASEMEQKNTPGASTATGRPVIYATQGIISSGHYLTSMAGMQMLLSGGNAFDAIVASGFAAAVIEPIASYSLASEGVFMLHHPASGDLLSLSGQGVAPAMATPDFYKSQGLDCIPTGPGKQAPLSFTVPGVVDAFLSLLERYGTKTISEVLEPAIRFAEQGIPNYEYMLERIDSPTTQGQFNNFPPGGSDIFYENGKVPRPGSMLVQSELANVLKAMVKPKQSVNDDRLSGIAYARNAFYSGEIAETIVRCSNRVGGILSLEDLSNYQAKYEEPVSITFQGYEISGQGPWTQAPVLLEALNILEQHDLKSMGHNSPSYIHVVTESLKLALADREAHYGDPDFSHIPIEQLLRKEYGLLRSKMIDLNSAHPELPPAGELCQTPHPTRTTTATTDTIITKNSDPNPQNREEGTTHISVMDLYGNIVCGTISGGSFAKSVFFPELGCALSTRIEMFNLETGHPNVLEPKKRPRTTLINYIVSKNSQPLMTIGCPGGDDQAQANLQILLNTLVFEMNPQEAVEAPRFSTHSVTNSFYPHVYYPGRLALEADIPEKTANALQSLGHKIDRASTCGMGATVTQRNPQTGVLSSSADPRRACYAIGW